MNVNAIVSSTGTRPVTIRNGPKAGNTIVAYEVVATDGTKYDAGFTNLGALGIGPGTELEFDSTDSPYGKKITKGTIRVMGQGRSVPKNTPAQVATGATKTYNRGTFPISKTSGEFSIIRQNALTNAREMVMASIPLYGGDPTSDEELAERILKVANIFADFSSGHREVKMAERIVRKHGQPTSQEGIDLAVSKFLTDVADEEVVEDATTE